MLGLNERHTRPMVERVLNCHPKAGHPGVHRPRPECFLPVDALQVVEQLISNETM